jgi:hypothetical protein
MLSLNDDFLNVVTTTFKKTSFGDVFLKDVIYDVFLNVVVDDI